MKFIAPVIVVFILNPLLCYSQTDTPKVYTRGISSQVTVISKTDSARQRDAIDIVKQVLDKKQATPSRTAARRLNFSVVPSPGYTLPTGFVLDLTGNVAFYTGAGHNENLSALQTDIAYATKAQRLLYNRGEVWSPDNQYRLVADGRGQSFRPKPMAWVHKRLPGRQTKLISITWQPMAPCTKL